MSLKQKFEEIEEEVRNNLTKPGRLERSNGNPQGLNLGYYNPYNTEVICKKLDTLAEYLDEREKKDVS